MMKVRDELTSVKADRNNKLKLNNYAKTKKSFKIKQQKSRF